MSRQPFHYDAAVRAQNEEEPAMKMLGTLIAGTLFAVLIATPVSAQQPAASQDAHHPPAQAGTPATPEPAAVPGMKADAMPMMDMCRRMMGDMAGMPMAGGAAPADPQARAEMMQMRGEMMKAMGEIMMKHARHMQGMKSE
jgi:hypothetical protein